MEQAHEIFIGYTYILEVPFCFLLNIFPLYHTLYFMITVLGKITKKGKRDNCPGPTSLKVN